MTPHNGLFTSESVAEGHPDKLADRIADALLDEFLRPLPAMESEAKAGSPR